MESKLQIKIGNNIISSILFSSFISSILIMLLHNTSVDEYFKYITIPLGILLLNYGVIIYILKPKINKKAHIFLIPIIIILISNIILKIDSSNLFLNIIIMPIIMAMYFFSLINENYHISRRFISWCFKLFPSDIFENFKYLKNLKKKNTKHEKLVNIAVGTCIALPIAIILISLLASADRYFAELVDSIGRIFSYNFRTDILFGNLFIFCFFFIVFYNILINVIKHKNTKEADYHLFNISSDILKTILVIINAIFILFLISELSKITFNFLSLPIKYTYAEYAREGFFQLLFVTIINFSIISYYLYFEKKALENMFIKNMIKMLIAFSVLLIFNSYYRMFLYIDFYGFTILRLQVILFLLMEIIIFIIMFKKIIYGLKYKDALIFSYIVITTYIINLYLCTQPFIYFINKLLHK